MNLALQPLREGGCYLHSMEPIFVIVAGVVALGVGALAIAVRLRPNLLGQRRSWSKQ